MLVIAVLDDERKYVEIVREVTAEYFSKKRMDYQLREYSNQETMLLDMDEKDDFDMFLLDVELKEGSGLETAAQIRKRDAFPAIIYITNFPEYAPAAFEVNAFRYILKKELREKLPMAYEQICPRLLEKDMRSYVIRTDSYMEKIYYRDILYVKKERKYVTFYQKNKKYSSDRKTIDETENILGDDFVRIDRGILANIQHVMSINQQYCRMRDDTELRISQRRLQEVRKKVLGYWENESGYMGSGRKWNG